ncbi:MAG: thioredoxin-disulfide reductase [Lentisphaerae bacterium]|jgi:thioredoxin reductase (NADPH)|nr:thioredoxin-disulfide reductase [Lentisphaerota bacterium]MBT4814207.1 thioredoxin-disulfide reductase [Lentisphaerota bacterium]MBT5607169.1 thioredoxin-disulfide reductase [Lentisphaerota bacterium]MBT7059499.1 thioredoxin-disulfide reductase [Lentisphaerota bacterium]MBT7840336.1 thioredoxin-disulfide reductase [Lentisphaerota bacterium]
MENVTIIGTGPAGLTAAIYAARADLEPLVLSGNLPGGQLTQTTDVENYPGFPAGIQGFDLMEALRGQAERFGTRIKSDAVTGVDLLDGGPQSLTLASGTVLETKALVVATGARPRWLDLPSEEALKNKGVSGCATCDGAFFRDVPIVVVGGGDSALEEALFLTRFGSKVMVVHRRGELRGSKIMQARALAHEKIEFLWHSVVHEILDVSQDTVTGIVLRDVRDDSLRTVDCSAVFVAIGHIPNTDVFEGKLAMADGYILPRECGRSFTSVEGVFVAGDCADHIYRQAITAAGMGCQAAIDAERWLAEVE